MEGKSPSMFQISLQVKRCKIGWIWSVKYAVMDASGLGVKWHTMGEDVFEELAVKGMWADQVKAIIERAVLEAK